MPKPTVVDPRVPPIINGIQVNCCKNLECKNFGKPASHKKQPRGPGALTHPDRDSYTITADGNGNKRLQCNVCGQTHVIKSNLAINEEFQRQLKDLELPPEPGCRNPGCENFQKGIKKHPKLYGPHGESRSKSIRKVCKACGKTFSIGSAVTGQKKSYINRRVFIHIMEKSPIRCLARALGISTNTIYNKLNFLEKQCLLFSAHRERRLLKGKKLPKLHIGIDRQEYTINWSSRSDRRNVSMRAVASVDNKTGYVFGMHLDFDPSMDMAEINKDAITSGDLHRKIAFRKYARLWLWDDHSPTGLLGRFLQDVKKVPFCDLLSTNPQSMDKDYGASWLDFPRPTQKLPDCGMQVHSEYTLYAHMRYLRMLTVGSEKVNIYMDQESAIREAFLMAFQDDIFQGRCDGFYVSINKDLNQPQKEAAVSSAKRFMDELRVKYPYDISDWDLKLIHFEELIKKARKKENWKDRWVSNPFSNMSEPHKKILHLTDIGLRDEEQLSWSYARASLHRVDNFFMKIRRSINLLERPPHSPSQNAVWHGYAPYNPGMVIKMQNIHRAYYNYVETGDDGQTPAMRLGLAKGPVPVEKILYFSPI